MSRAGSLCWGLLFMFTTFSCAAYALSGEFSKLASEVALVFGTFTGVLAVVFFLLAVSCKDQP